MQTIRRPWPIYAVGWLYLLMPAGNILLIALPLKRLGIDVLAYLSLISLALLLTAPVIGYGILRVKKWAYYGFLIHIALLIGYNLYTSLHYNKLPYWANLIRSVPPLLALWYFLRREIAAPYLQVISRGFRVAKRKQVAIHVIMNGAAHSIRDITLGGCFLVPPPVGELSKTDTVKPVHLILDPEGLALPVRGDIIRITSEGIGIKFKRLVRAQKRALRKMLRSPELQSIAILVVVALGGIVNCVPAENPRDNTLGQLMVAGAHAPVPASAVPIQMVEDMFPASGPYSLRTGEKETLQLSMYQRYDDGFYEPALQVANANQMLDTMAYAVQEDGKDYDALGDELVTDIESRLPTIQPEMLFRLRFVAANSAILSAEINGQSTYAENGIDPELMNRSRERMMNLYHKISDEIQRRGL